MCIVLKFWNLRGGCRSGRKIDVDTFRSRAWVLASFSSTEILTQGAAVSSQIFVSEFI